QGICFVGSVGIREFLSNYIKTKPGKILDQNGKQIGEHDGAIFYTIGQRHGLYVGGGLPYYVTGKDMKKNEVYVTTNLDDKNLWSKQIKLASPRWINPDFEAAYKLNPKNYKLAVRTRHRAKLIPARILNKSRILTAELEQEV